MPYFGIWYRENAERGWVSGKKQSKCHSEGRNGRFQKIEYNQKFFGCHHGKITVGRRQVGVYTPHLPPAIIDMVLAIATLPKFESLLRAVLLAAEFWPQRQLRVPGSGVSSGEQKKFILSQILAAFGQSVWSGPERGLAYQSGREKKGAGCRWVAKVA